MREPKNEGDGPTEWIMDRLKIDPSWANLKWHISIRLGASLKKGLERDREHPGGLGATRGEGGQRGGGGGFQRRVPLLEVSTRRMFAQCAKKSLSKL